MIESPEFDDKTFDADSSDIEYAPCGATCEQAGLKLTNVAVTGKSVVVERNLFGSIEHLDFFINKGMIPHDGRSMRKFQTGFIYKQNCRYMYQLHPITKSRSFRWLVFGCINVCRFLRPNTDFSTLFEVYKIFTHTSASPFFFVTWESNPCTAPNSRSYENFIKLLLIFIEDLVYL